MISYVNRKNITYYLHLRPTATGKVGYVMTRSSEGALDVIPPGMEIVENVNAQVSVRVRRKRIITEAEEMLVRKELEALALTHYRVEIKNRTWLLYNTPWQFAGNMPSTHPFGMHIRKYGKA